MVLLIKFLIDLITNTQLLTNAGIAKNTEGKMRKLPNVILSILFASAFLTVWGVVTMGCEEEVCSGLDILKCEDRRIECLEEQGEKCNIKYCQCIDDEGCDFNDVPVCEE